MKNVNHKIMQQYVVALSLTISVLLTPQYSWVRVACEFSEWERKKKNNVRLHWAPKWEFYELNV